MQIGDLVGDGEAGADHQARIACQPVCIRDQVPQLGIAIHGHGDTLQGVACTDDIAARRGGRVLVGDGGVVVVEVRRPPSAAGADRVAVGVEVVLGFAVFGLLQEVAGEVAHVNTVLGAVLGIDQFVEVAVYIVEEVGIAGLEVGRAAFVFALFVAVVLGVFLGVGVGVGADDIHYPGQDIAHRIVGVADLLGFAAGAVVNVLYGEPAIVVVGADAALAHDAGAGIGVLLNYSISQIIGAAAGEVAAFVGGLEPVVVVVGVALKP